MTTPFLICAIATAISAFVSLGFSIAALRSTGDTHVNAMYFSSRSLALAVVSVVPFFSGSRSWLLTVAITMIIVQAVDGYAGLKQHDTRKTIGPILISLANLAAVILLARS
jgi:hypothetical protein